MLKLNLTKEQRSELSTYLKDELTTCLADRAELEGKWKDWERQYEARPEESEKSFPWSKACNVVVPLTGSIIDALLARLMSIFQVDPFWTAVSTTTTLDKFMDGIEKILDWANKHELRLFKSIIPTMLSTLKFGNGFSKLPWVDENRFTGLPGAEYVHVPIYDLLFPLSSRDIYSAPWLAHRLRYRWSDLKKLERVGKISGLKDLKKLEDEQGAVSESVLAGEERDLARTPTLPSEIWNFYDCWMYWDANGDEIDEEIHCLVDAVNFTIVGAWANEYGHRPFRHFKLFPRENNIYAMGMCEYLYDLQEELTTIHRQTTDNVTIANTRFWKATSTSGVKPGTKIWPGRVLIMDDINGMVGEAMGDIYPSSIQREMIIMSLAEKRAGVSDVALGKAPRKETATTTLTLMQEGNRRFEFIINYVKDELAELALDYVELHQAMMPEGKAFYLIGEDGQRMDYALTMPFEPVRRKLVLKVTAGSEIHSKEVERQQLIQLFGLYEQFYRGMFEVVGMLSQPGMPPLMQAYAMEVAKSSTEFLRQITEDFDIRKVKDLLPDIMALFSKMQGGPVGGEGGMGNGNGQGGTPGIEGEPSMADFMGSMVGATGGPPAPSMVG